MHTKRWVKFTLLRLAFILVPLAILLALKVSLLVSIVAATLIGLALSVIFLHRQRSALSADLYSAKRRRHIPIETDGPAVADPDADIENEIVDGQGETSEKPAAK